MKPKKSWAPTICWATALFVFNYVLLSFLYHEQTTAKVGWILLWLGPVHDPRNKVTNVHQLSTGELLLTVVNRVGLLRVKAGEVDPDVGWVSAVEDLEAGSDGRTLIIIDYLPTVDVVIVGVRVFQPVELTELEEVPVLLVEGYLLLDRCQLVFRQLGDV